MAYLASPLLAASEQQDSSDSWAMVEPKLPETNQLP